MLHSAPQHHLVNETQRKSPVGMAAICQLTAYMRVPSVRFLPLERAGQGRRPLWPHRGPTRWRATYAARSGEHDDLVLAVTLAAWFGTATRHY